MVGKSCILYTNKAGADAVATVRKAYREKGWHWVPVHHYKATEDSDLGEFQEFLQRSEGVVLIECATKEIRLHMIFSFNVNSPPCCGLWLVVSDSAAEIARVAVDAAKPIVQAVLQKTE